MAIAQESPLRFVAATVIEDKRFVVVDKATLAATLAVDENVDGITVGYGNNGYVSVVPVSQVGQEVEVVAGATIAVGDGLMADANGKAIPVTAETPVAYAKNAAVAGEIVAVYNL